MRKTQNIDFLMEIYSQNDFLPKTKIVCMVCMVHRNLFHEMGLEIDDEKKVLWRKSEKIGRSKNSKISFEVQNGVFEGFVKDEITSKYIAVPSATILA